MLLVDFDAVGGSIHFFLFSTMVIAYSIFGHDERVRWRPAPPGSEMAMDYHRKWTDEWGFARTRGRDTE
jgi:hypothetical protein